MIDQIHGALVINLLEFVAIFGVDNPLSSHSDNRKNNLLVLGEEPSDCINDNVVTTEKK